MLTSHLKTYTEREGWGGEREGKRERGWAERGRGKRREGEREKAVATNTGLSSVFIFWGWSNKPQTKGLKQRNCCLAF